MNRPSSPSPSPPPSSGDAPDPDRPGEGRSVPPDIERRGVVAATLILAGTLGAVLFEDATGLPGIARLGGALLSIAAGVVAAHLVVRAGRPPDGSSP